MNIILSVLELVLWMGIIPMCTGIAFNFILPRIRRTVGITFILGFLIYMAVFEIIAIACMTTIVYSAFLYCRRYFTIAGIILALAGIARGALLLYRSRTGRNFLVLFPGEAHGDVQDFLSPRSDPRFFKADYSKESIVYWIIFFVIMGAQMVMSLVMASFDGDDAFYVVESLLAQQADVMNTILPYTGNSTSLDIRHALAVITMWIGFLAKKSDIHATILSHCIMPLFVLPLVYLVYVEIGRIIFRKKQQVIPVFMIIVSFLLMFGNVSIYTPATFLFMRTWQGKALVANMVFPMIFWMFLWMMEDVRKDTGTVFADRKDVNDLKTGVLGASSANAKTSDSAVIARYKKLAEKRTKAAPWIILAFVNMLSGVCSSMGVIFGSGLIALLTLIMLFNSKRLSVLIGAFVCVIPNLIYLAIYFSLFSR